MIVEAAPAKLNLSLRVVGRRADGYHLLDSLVAFADIGDTVTLVPADRLTLSVDGPFASALADATDNLVLRAARAFGIGDGVEIRLTKNLPVASGIGGGSADAAATLRALVRLRGKRPDLATVARGLGADVPVCLGGTPAWMSGTGEILEPAGPLPEAGLLLVNPGIAVATKDVFAARTGAFSTPARFAIPGDATGLAQALAGTSNDLAAPARTLAPAIGDVLAALEKLPGTLVARMSGSGATCFALFADRMAARTAETALRRHAPPGWWIAAGGWASSISLKI